MKDKYQLVATAVISALAGVIVGAMVIGLVGNDTQPVVDLGGKTRLPEVNVSWIELGEKVSSSTDPVYKFTVSYQISGSEDRDSFVNTQLGTDGNQLNLIITKAWYYFASTSPNALRIFSGTSTTGVYVEANANQNTLLPPDCALYYRQFATSTGANFVNIIDEATSSPVFTGSAAACGDTLPVFLKYGQSLSTVLLPCGALENDAKLGRTDNSCQPATSTHFGLKPVTIFLEGYATTTPSIPDQDTR